MSKYNPESYCCPNCYLRGIEHESERIIKIIAQQEWSGHYWDKEQNTANCKCRNCEDVRELIRLIS